MDCLTEGEGAVAWPLQAFAGPAKSLNLDASTVGYTGWYLAPAQTAALKPGVYILRAHLDTSGTKLTGAWKGRASSAPVRVRVLDEPSRADSLLIERKNLT
jgi:hypothetical protein